MNWINVKDRLPENDRDCLCLYHNSMYVLWHSNGKFYMDLRAKKYFEDWADGVTHWMPLPEPPKD